MEFYHGSSIMRLKELKSNFDTLNTVKSNVVYYTKHKTLALFYIWNRPYKYATFHINNEGIIEYTENFPNQLYEFYNGVSGCIYVCNNKDNIITKSHVKDVYISSKSIEVTKTIFVDNVYNEIKKAELKGDVIIKKYDMLTSDEKDKLSKDTIRSIHMIGLLNPKQNSQIAMAKFIREKFPDEWKIAEKNSNEEIKEMINEWRKSRGLKLLYIIIKSIII